MKKMIFLGLTLFSTNTFADVISATHIDPMQRIATGVTSEVYTSHDYTINNDTNVNQTVQVCFDINACVDYPQWLRNAHSCVSVTVPPHKIQSYTKPFSLSVRYPFKGSCKVNASTDVTGWTHYKSNAEGQLWVSPN